MFEQLHIYARRNTYVYIPAQSHADIEYSHTQTNDLCKDVLTIHIIKNAQSKKYYKVMHCGSYCTLVHLSCELLCEILSKSPYTQWDLILKNIAHHNENTIYNTFESMQKEALEMFVQLHAKTISKQRRACLMLPYKVLTTIIHTMNTEIE